jgi:hypothetical protein
MASLQPVKLNRLARQAECRRRAETDPTVVAHGTPAIDVERSLQTVSVDVTVLGFSTSYGSHKQATSFVSRLGEFIGRQSQPSVQLSPCDRRQSRDRQNRLEAESTSTVRERSP